MTTLRIKINSFLCLYLLLQSAWLYGQSGSADKIRMLAPPSNEHLNVVNQTMFTAMCYGFTSGREVECSNEYIYTGLGAEGVAEDCIYTTDGDLDRESCINGGHTHSDNRPQTFDDTRPIALDGDDQDPSVFGVYGVQLVVDGQPTVEPIITVDVSQVAGFYSWSGVLRIETPGWMFHDGPGVQPENTAYVYEGVTEVGIRGLKQLPVSADYAKVRSPDIFHKDAVAFSGTAEMIEAVSTLAVGYNEMSGNLNYKLSINDLSLPLGGVFDDREDWSAPHRTHRAGVDADLNRQPVNGTAPIPCTEDELLHRAATQTLAPFSATRESAVLCELDNNNRKHLDLTRVLQ